MRKSQDRRRTEGPVGEGSGREEKSCLKFMLK
jgi:hypothetical protein